MNNLTLQSEFNSLTNKSSVMSGRQFAISPTRHEIVSQNTLRSVSIDAVHNVPPATPSVHIGPKIDPAVLPLLGKYKILVDGLTRIIALERMRCNIPLHQVEIRMHVDVENGRKLIHIKQTVKADAQAALEFWDKASGPVDQWIGSLPQSEADIVRDEIWTTIHWTGDVPG